jgi:hypothetical protein
MQRSSVEIDHPCVFGVSGFVKKQTCLIYQRRTQWSIHSCGIAGDHGPFNSWDRQVWEWLDDSSGVPTKTIIKKYLKLHLTFISSGD